MITGEELELFARSLRHATAEHTGAALDDALAELGWFDAIEVDPRAAIATFFELQGAANVTSSALDHVVRTGLGVDPASRRRVIMSPYTTARPAGARDGTSIRVDGIALGPIEGDVLVPVGDAGVGTVGVAALSQRAVGGLDPSARLVEVSGSAPASVEPATWGEAVRRARLALGHEIVGAGRTMLALARDHAVERIQFGRPIAMFQAVRHRLAEALVAVEASDAALGAAWDDGTPRTAAMANALAGRNVALVRKHCQQVLAGVGFTGEHDFHRHLRRSLVLDGLFGDTRTVTREIGAELIEAGSMPQLVRL